LHDFGLGLRLLVRALRAGELTLLVVALALAVASMATVSVFTDRTRLALELAANRLLGADLVLTSTRAIASELKQEAKQRGLRAISTLAFRSMVVRGDAQLLAEITAVEPGYPLRGTTRISGGRGEREQIPQAIPEPSTLWADERLLSPLNLNVGDSVDVGQRRFAVAALLTQDPSMTLSVLGLGPRLIMTRGDIESTGLLGPGSRVVHRLLVAGERADVSAYREWARSRLAPGVRLEGVRDARPSVRAALERAGRFMGLAALTAVVLAAVAVLLAARRFYERQLDVCAMLRCLGASQLRVFFLQLIQLLGAGVAASAIGCVIGLFAQSALSSMLTAAVAVELPAPSLGSALRAVALGLVLLLAFGLPPLAGLRRVSALRVLRRDLGAPKAAGIAGYVGGIVCVVGLTLWQARDLRLGAYVLAGCTATVLIAALLTGTLLRVSAGASRATGVSWRYGVASLRRRVGATLWQVVALSLGLTAVLTLTVVRADLLSAWQSTLPANAPNRFLVNIQPDQVRAVDELLSTRLATRLQFYPMVRGRLIAVNGREVRSENFSDERAKRLAEREFNLTWGEQLPVDNRVVAGYWHAGTPSVKRALSVEEGIARVLELKLGDRLTYDVAGSRFEAPVTSLRQVEWDSFRPNFFVIAASGVLENYPATYITSFHLPADKAGVLRELVRQIPSVIVIDVGTLLRQVQAMITQASKAVQFVFVFTLLAGILVLYAGVIATHDERIREVAVMRTLGASRSQVIRAYAAEFGIIGALSGLLAATGASGLGYFIATELLGLPYQFDPSVLVLGLVAGVIGVGAAGLWFTRRVLLTPPMVSLRQVA
jgi:putative ABC transport system permease protein